jgi:hypothetical protein
LSTLSLPSIFEYLHKYLDFSGSIKNAEHGIEVKSRVLTIYTTLLLMSMQSDSVDLDKFSKCLITCCEGIMTQLDVRSTGPATDFKTQCVTIFNRFFLMKTEDITSFVTSHVNLSKFIEAWLVSMKSMTSKKATRINSFSILTAVSNFPLEATYPFLPALLEHTFTDMLIESETVKPEAVTSYALRQKRLSSFSYRKEDIRKGQLLENHSLLRLFKETMTKLMNTLKEKGLSFPDVPPAFQEKAQFFLNSSPS